MYESCEMCNGNDVVKQDDLYVCQSCGTKYETEAARKLMIEIDDSGKLNNLYTLARRARDNNESEKAEQYYTEILTSNPDDWEAYFYSTFFKTSNTTIANIAVEAGRLANAIPTTFDLLRRSSLTNHEKVMALDSMSRGALDLVDSMMAAAIRT